MYLGSYLPSKHRDVTQRFPLAKHRNSYDERQHEGQKAEEHVTRLVAWGNSSQAYNRTQSQRRRSVRFSQSQHQ